MAVDKNILGTEPIGRLLIKLGLPTVVAQLIALLYNIVDRIYIGHIPEVGSIALTGVGVTLPLIITLNAFAVFVGAGGAPLMSIALGAKEQEKAEKILNNSYTLLLGFALSLCIIYLLFKTELLYAFGATEQIMTYADTYISICTLGVIFVMLSLGLNQFISAQGFAKTAMLSITIGAVVNIVLDPLFIFVFNMGVAGAALATVISQFVSAVWVVRFLTSSKGYVQLKWKSPKLDFAIAKRILALGSSPFIMQLTESAIIIVFNVNLKEYGGYLHLGTMTILQSIMQMIFIPVNGFRAGVQPIMSYNYGARNFERVKVTAFYTIGVCFIYGALFSLFCIFSPGTFARIFADSKNAAELIGLVEKYLPIFVSGMLIFGLQMGGQAYFVALGQAGKSAFLAILRKVILLIPLVYILPRYMGVAGVYWAEPIADALSGLVCGAMFLFTYKHLLNEKYK